MSIDPKLTTLDPMAMHAAVEVIIATHVRLPDGRNGALQFRMEPGRIPTRADIKAVVDACLNPASMAESSIPAGTRMLNKGEFVAFITKRETGQATPMQGSQEFEPVGTDIPKSMLVHAIVGAGVPGDLVAEYAERGLVYADVVHGGMGDFWNEAKLAELPEDMLLTIYKRIA